MSKTLFIIQMKQIW